MLAVDLTQLVNLTISGLLTGAVYALIAAGLGMIFGVMRVVNFAQGEFMMLAMYMTWALFAGTVGLDPFLSAPLVFIVFCALGMLIHWLIIRWVSGRRENFDAQVLATVGLGLIFQNLILLRYSSTPRVVAPSYATSGIEVGAIFISQVRLYASLLSLLVAALLFLFLNRSRIGRAIRVPPKPIHNSPATIPEMYPSLQLLCRAFQVGCWCCKLLMVNMFRPNLVASGLPAEVRVQAETAQQTLKPPMSSQSPGWVLPRDPHDRLPFTHWVANRAMDKRCREFSSGAGANFQHNSE